MYGRNNDEITTYHEGKLEHLLQIELNISACIVGISILTNFGKIERTYHLLFQGGLKTMCVNGKVSSTKKFTCVTNHSIC